MKKLILIPIILLQVSVALSAESKKSSARSKLDSLGGNEEIARRAKNWDGAEKVRIVQKRAVDRTWRVEVGMNYGVMAGGDSYATTENFGGNLDVHINPHWSVGARYYKYYSDLTPEGQRVLDDAKNRRAAGESFVKPGLDFPLESGLAVLSFYPIYGKLNFFDLGVAQFDIYVLGGYGETRTSNTSSPTWTAGGGIGLWLAQHFASRLEVRYQNYQDQIYTGNRDINAVVSTLSIGFLL